MDNEDPILKEQPEELQRHVMSSSGCWWSDLTKSMYHTHDCSCDDDYMESLDD